MRNYHKLLELDNNNVKIGITNRYNQGGKNWNISADKSADGVSFSIDRYYHDIEEGIDDIHSIWTQHTKTMPEHRLNILEYRPFNPDDPTGSDWKERQKAFSEALDTIPLGVYYVIGEGFFTVDGLIKGQTFYDKWNTRWSEFPTKTLDEHRDIVADQIPF